MSYVDDTLPLWPLLPNWKVGVKEALEFRTRVIGPTLTGTIQKRRMRRAPRRSFAFEVHPYRDGRRLLDNLRFAQGRGEWYFPILPDRQSLAATLAIGATSIPCDTVGRDFVVGGKAVLRARDLYTTTFEFVEIDSIDADAINLVGATTAEWPKGTFLYPIRKGRLKDDSNNLILRNAEVSTLSVSVEVSEPCDWDAHTFEHEYLGQPVWEFPVNWRSSRNLAFNRVVQVDDNDVALPRIVDFSGRTFSAIDADWMLKTFTDKTLFRAVAYALAGRYKSLWVPTLANDLQVSGSIVGASLPITWCGYDIYGEGREGRRDVRIELYDGTVYYRRITGSTVFGDTEFLTLSSSLGGTVSAANVRRISFMMLMQQATDVFNIAHATNTVANATLVFEGVAEID